VKKAALFFSVLLLASSAWAAELPVGKWTGNYIYADDDPLRVKYKVEKLVSEQVPAQVSWKIVMTAAGVAIDFKQVRLSAGKLQFRMNPGEEVDCSLSPGEGGVYKGECRSVAEPEAEQVITIFMRPPAPATAPAELEPEQGKNPEPGSENNTQPAEWST